MRCSAKILAMGLAGHSWSQQGELIQDLDIASGYIITQFK